MGMIEHRPTEAVAKTTFNVESKQKKKNKCILFFNIKFKKKPRTLVSCSNAVACNQ